MLLGRVVGPGEPLYLQQDTDLALALTAIEDETCDGCGHLRSESMDLDSEFDWVAEPVRCHACTARDRAADEAAGVKGWRAAGIRWLTTRREREVGGGGQ